MIVALRIRLLSNWVNKVSPNIRVSSISESVHVNMSLLILEISLRRVALSPKNFELEKKTKSRFNIRATTTEGFDGI